MYEAVRQSESPVKQHAMNVLPSSDVDDLVPLVQRQLAIQEEDEYVYDLYLRETNPQLVNTNNLGSLVWMDDELVEMSDSQDEDYGTDDQDSNAEDYYGNDYPDEQDNWTEDGEDAIEEDDFY
jgi:hypothetical protein